VLSVPAKATVLWILGAAGTPDRDGFVGAGTEDGLIIADGLGLAVDAERRSLLRFKTEKGPATLTICPSAGVQLALDYLVTVPSPASVLRVFGMHRKEKHGNGMTAKFLVNGKEIFSTPMPREDDRWHQWDIPLGASAGKWRRAPWRPGRSPALITLIANCNGDTNCDNMRLTRPRIVEDASVTGPRHQVLEGAK
jgi:hypothetical protein